MLKPSIKNTFKKNFTKVSNSIVLFSKTLPGEIIKITVVIATVLLLSWGVSSATDNEFESATNTFSVIGTVSVLSNTTISLMNARGSDTTEEELYNLNIEYLDRVETKDYQPLIISDIRPGDTIIAQGLTNGRTFFIKRIISFSDTPLPPVQETATSTPEVEVVISTENQATSSDEELNSSSSDTLIDQSTSSTTITNVPNEITVETVVTDESATSTETIIDTVTNILEDGLDTASDVLDTIIETISGSDDVTELENIDPLVELNEDPIEESIQEPNEEQIQDSTPVE